MGMFSTAVATSPPADQRKLQSSAVILGREILAFTTRGVTVAGAVAGVAVAAVVAAAVAVVAVSPQPIHQIRLRHVEAASRVALIRSGLMSRRLVPLGPGFSRVSAETSLCRGVAIP